MLTPYDIHSPEVDVLIRRWGLPCERVANVESLLAAHGEGGTATPLRTQFPLSAEAWGNAAVDLGETLRAENARPLVLCAHRGQNYVQAWRFYQAEKFIAENLAERAACMADLSGAANSVWSSLREGDLLNKRQTKAIECALKRPLTLITGGPGTGKTHTLARLLALLVAAGGEGSPPVIRLAAPTGKAAERMREAVESAASRLPASVPKEIADSLRAAAAEAGTLHRLLGFNPANGRCRHNADEPLHVDVLIIDECSMIDTLLWQALLRATPKTTRVILLGDPHQLESVAAGDILGAVVRHVHTQPRGPLASVWVELQESQRFKARPAIGALAEAVVSFDADAALRVLRENRGADAPTGDGVTWLPTANGRFSWSGLPEALRARIQDVAFAETPREALLALQRVRLLTAYRESGLGATGLNAMIERSIQELAGEGRLPNRPIIINRNDRETGLTNGSVGIIMTVEGRLRAFFPSVSAAEPPREVSLSRLPEYSPAWAMTIHRSQGSEFEQVLVVLPEAASPLATRELLYTGITRARERVFLTGEESTLRAALSDRSIRCTLLDAHLTRCESSEKTLSAPR